MSTVLVDPRTKKHTETEFGVGVEENRLVLSFLPFGDYRALPRSTINYAGRLSWLDFRPQVRAILLSARNLLRFEILKFGPRSLN